MQWAHGFEIRKSRTAKSLSISQPELALLVGLSREPESSIPATQGRRTPALIIAEHDIDLRINVSGRRGHCFRRGFHPMLMRITTDRCDHKSGELSIADNSGNRTADSVAAIPLAARN